MRGFRELQVWFLPLPWPASWPVLSLFLKEPIQVESPLKSNSAEGSPVCMCQ